MTFSEGGIAVLEKIANYEEVRVKLKYTQLNKLKSAAQNKTRITLRITRKKFQYKELPQCSNNMTKTQKKKAFTKNMSTDIKISKSQLSKIIQSGGLLGKTLSNMMSNLGKNFFCLN